ncbi:helix-turn-helix domain-containing protein [Halalkalibacter krulwichiae]|uniref:HTH-type transcriptional regulator SinR n=1 Tax=Halalkalibacter krulwichiae TaxID=199441 RepID=A0A1X9MLP5_9BACI|nr:helix-turn-helix transcriptional regulator [Halalkalibacter krulwichiae]ARK32861.1 HTH-type transcriptional regulator SinR [Halalkalibacter krulwichiae]
MVGETIKKYRMKRNLSVAKLAELAMVEKSYISLVERGTTVNPSVPFLEKIAQALDISVEVFLTDNSDTTDSIWEDVVTEALESGLTTEEYLNFLTFTKRQRTLKKQHIPIKQHLKTFIENQKLGTRVASFH